MSSDPPEAATTTDNDTVKDVEKQSESTHGTDTSAPKKSFAYAKWILVIVVVIGIVCAISIPLTLRKRDSKQAKAEDNSIISPSNSNITSTTGTSPSNNTDTSSNSVPDSEPVSNRTERSYQNISIGPVTSSLELFSTDITQGYTTDKDLQSDLFNAFKYLLGVQYNQLTGGNRDSISVTDTEMSDVVLADAPAASVGGAASKLTGSDFGTNNQEQGVEEGDILVSDGQYVFAAYGKYLVIWSVSTGTILKTIEMPSANATSSETTTTARKSDMIMYPPESTINSLVLHQGKLLVTVSMFEDVYVPRILSNYMSTSIRLYDVASLMFSPSSTADAGLVGMKFISGSFSSVRVTNGVAHLVATSNVNSYLYLNYPYMEDNETVAAYDARIGQMTEELSQNFTEQLMKELQAGGATPQLTRINLWDASYPDSSSYNPYSGGLLQTLVTINSIDLSSQINGAELTVSSSGSFVPGWSYVYGVANRLILATAVYEYNVNTSASVQSVALLAFDLNGASATARSIGRVPGSILNEYYVDVLGDNLRIAVTIRNDTMVSQLEMGGNMMIDSMPLQSPDTENYVIVMSLPSATSDNPGQMIEQSRVKIGKPKESITTVRFFDTYAYAMTAEKKDPFYVIDVSNAANLSVVAELEIPGFSSYLHPITSDGTRLLAIGESSDDEGLVTGIQLTVFDVSVPSNPKNISRFVLDAGSNASVYTQSAWDFKSSRYYDGYLFLPVDLSSYYSTNPLDSFMGTMVFKIDNVTGAITEDTQCRIANQQMISTYYPMEVSIDPIEGGSSSLPFPGSGNVTKEPCNYTAYINPRSMIFNGNVMTTRQSEVIMTDLNTCGRLWNFTIGIPHPDGCPVYNW